MNTSKFFRAFVAVFFAVSFFGCEEILDKIAIDFKSGYYDFDFTVNPDDIETGVYTFNEEAYKSDLDSLLDENDLDKDNLKSVELDELTLEIINNNIDITFDGIENFELYISATGMPEILIAKIESVPPGTRTLNFSIEGKELKEYLEKDMYTIRLKGSISEIPSGVVQIDGKLRFAFTGGL